MNLCVVKKSNRLSGLNRTSFISRDFLHTGVRLSVWKGLIPLRWQLTAIMFSANSALTSHTVGFNYDTYLLGSPISDQHNLVGRNQESAKCEVMSKTTLISSYILAELQPDRA